MKNQEKKRNEKDDFWDISALIPKRSQKAEYSRSVLSPQREISIYETAKKVPEREETVRSDTVIKRYIPPHTDTRLTKKESFEFCKSYLPDNSLLHRVTLKKQACAYHYYGEFLSDAIRYQNVSGSPCDFVAFFSYVPQYNQLTSQQLAYYFWFRENARNRVFLDTDYSYILLFIYELINLGDRSDVKKTQAILTALWDAYHKKFPALASKLADWICDFSLIHRLPPPSAGGEALARQVISLKEFFIAMPDGDIDGCARSLLRFCCSYDYRSSKFYKAEHTVLFDTFVFGALREAVDFYSHDGRILSALTNEDSCLIRDAYAGALCVAKEKYRIEVEYCSFSRSNELRFMVGDIVKYVENRLRAHIGIKSKMSVYSLSTELRQRIDSYLDQNLPAKHVSTAKREKQEYEALYELPKKPFSLSDAKKIEMESWSTTKDLIVAFEDGSTDEESEKRTCPEERLTVEASDRENGQDGFAEFRPILIDLLAGKLDAVRVAAQRRGEMTDALADRINEIAFEEIGDAVIEEWDTGYRVIEEYKDLFE